MNTNSYPRKLHVCGKGSHFQPFILEERRLGSYYRGDGHTYKKQISKNPFIHGRSLKCGRTYRHDAFSVMRIADILHSATHCVLDRHITQCKHTVSLTDILHSATQCVLDRHITQCKYTVSLTDKVQTQCP